MLRRESRQNRKGCWGGVVVGGLGPDWAALSIQIFDSVEACRTVGVTARLG